MNHELDKLKIIINDIKQYLEVISGVINLNNENVVVEINGEVICKQYNQQSDHIWFKSLNREFSHEDRHIYDNNFRIIGKVVKIIH